MFELLLSAIATGGLAGAGNQYMCLLVLSIAAKMGWVGLVPQVAFVRSWWFFGVVALFWVVTVLPAYASAIGPGAMNVLNTITNILSGFVVPISGALLALAATGVIAHMHPTLYELLLTLRIFDPDGTGLGRIGWAMAGSAAVTSAALTGAKFLAKPAVSSATGTLGTTAAPVFATVENLAAIVLMALAYLLSRIDPWLIVALLALVAVVVAGVLVWAVVQLWRLGKGIARVVSLLETRPRAGLAVVGEFLVWGSGSLGWGLWAQGAARMALWVAWIAALTAGIPALGGALAVAVAPVPVLELAVGALLLAAEVLAVLIGLGVGIRLASTLLARLEGRRPGSRGAILEPAEPAWTGSVRRDGDV
jgi:hypothetical protein